MQVVYIAIIIAVTGSTPPSSMIMNSRQMFSSESECIAAADPTVKEVVSEYGNTKGVTVRAMCVPVETHVIHAF